MRISILHNRDHHLLEEDPGREAREDVVRVAAALQVALKGARRTVERIELGSDVFALGQALKDQRPDVVVNLCESLAADSRGEMIAPALLEMTGLPYTGSDALSLGLALHKDKAKELLRARGVPTPGFSVVSSVGEVMEVSQTLRFPLLVKPSREDASVGIDFESVVLDRAALGKAVARVLRTFGQPALVEEYIDGREIYVPLLGNHPRRNLPLTEIHYGKAFEGRPRILTYRAKWEPQSAECLDSASQPASLPASLQRRCVEVAMAAFEALGCRDYGRVDLRLDSSGAPYVIDINPNCDLHPQSGFAKAASAAGISYPDLAWHLVELALERSHGNSASATTRSPAARRAAGTHRDLLSTRGGMRARAHRPRADASKP
jgi:D-alanine-D-alanine ligase